MANFDRIDADALPYTFRGALAFNQRTVGNALATLQGVREDGSFLAGVPVTLAEIANVLLVLESVAMSNGLCLDGTLPPADVNRLRDNLWRVSTQSQVDLGVEFVRPKPEALAWLFKEAAEVAALLIDDSLANLELQRDRPMDGEITLFVAKLQAATEVSSGRVREQIAHEIVDDTGKGREGFRGSKCLAGLLLASPDPVPLVERAAARLLGTPEAVQRKVIAILVNRFRINYVNSLASLRDAAYLADTTIEDLKAQQVVLFSQYLAQRISAAHMKELSEETRGLFDHTLKAVPLGFAILMNTEGASPMALLEEAMKVRDRAFARAAARATPQKRYLHQLSDDEFGSFREYLFQRTWLRLRKEVELGVDSACVWRSICLPATIAGALGALVGGVVGGPPGAAAGASVMGILSTAGAGALESSTAAMVQHLGAGLASGRFAQRAVHADQYRKLDRYLKLAAENDATLQAFAKKVESLFQRPLATA